MADLLSQIQQKAKQVGTMMGQSTGVLQRDAVPVSLTGEDVPDAGSSVKIDNEAAFWAKGIVSGMKELEELIAQLPDDERTPDQQIADIASTQRQSYEVGEEIASVSAEIRRQLDVLEGLHAEMFEELLPKQKWIADDLERIGKSMNLREEGAAAVKKEPPE